MIIESELDNLVSKYFGPFSKENRDLIVHNYADNNEVRYLNKNTKRCILILRNAWSIYFCNIPAYPKYFNSIRDLEKYLILLPFE